MRRWLPLLTVLVMGLALTAPAFAQTVLFGTKPYTRTAGPPNQFIDTFTLPSGTTAPYTLHIVNGNANGTNRISSATVKLNGVQIAGPSDFGQNVAVIDRTVALQTTNTIEIRLTSAPGSFIRMSVLDTNAGTQPTALTPNPLGLTVGATANLTATLTPVPTVASSVTVTSSNASVVTVPASVAFTFYLLSSSAFAGDLSMATKVSLAGLPNEPKLLINLKNEGHRAIAFYKWQLPWVESHSLLVAAVREDGVSLKKARMFDDGNREVVSLGPGESLEGTVPISMYFPELHRDLKQTNVILFWTYQMVLKDGSKLERSGGWFSIPRSPEP